MLNFMFRRKPLLLLAAALSFLVFIVFSQQVMADMFSWFKKYDVHLSPAVHGSITFAGSPLTNVKVMRELTYDKEYLDFAITDNQGNFSFDEKNIRSRRPGSAFDTAKRQVLYVDYNNQRYVLWYFSTLNASAAKTLTEKMQHLRCELTQPEKTYELSNHEFPEHPHGVTGVCSLD